MADSNFQKSRGPITSRHKTTLPSAHSSHTLSHAPLTESHQQSTQTNEKIQQRARWLVCVISARVYSPQRFSITVRNAFTAKWSQGMVDCLSRLLFECLFYAMTNKLTCFVLDVTSPFVRPSSFASLRPDHKVNIVSMCSVMCGLHVFASHWLSPVNDRKSGRPLCQKLFFYCFFFFSIQYIIMYSYVATLIQTNTDAHTRRSRKILLIHYMYVAVPFRGQKPQRCR